MVQPLTFHFHPGRYWVGVTESVLSETVFGTFLETTLPQTDYNGLPLDLAYYLAFSQDGRPTLLIPTTQGSGTYPSVDESVLFVADNGFLGVTGWLPEDNQNSISDAVLVTSTETHPLVVTWDVDTGLITFTADGFSCQIPTDPE